MACGDPGLGTILGCFSPEGQGILVQTLPDFLMQWAHPHVVIDAIEIAQSARFEFGETPNVVPLSARASRPHPELPKPRSAGGFGF
jgi:hypothetical protein